MTTSGKNSAPSVFLISPEATPFAKTGGLGDMVGSFGSALRSAGIDVAFVLPKYGWIDANPRHPQGVPAHFVDLPEYFSRPGLYGEEGRDYPDNGERFASFCRGALALVKKLKPKRAVFHVHDWQTALIPFYLKTELAADPLFRSCRSLLTIHNLGYQGLFPNADFAIPSGQESKFEFHGRANLLKAGILSADAVSTVSPAYAREILTPELGYGLDGVLKEREKDFFGILNGIDTVEWNPSSDPHLRARYSADDLEGKRACKRALQRELGLPESDAIPVIGLIARFADQKGIDLAAEAIPALAASLIQWVFLGSGDPRLEGKVRDLAKNFPSKVAVRIGFDTPLAHRIEAGADFFLMPSRYEPCGYNQMYSQRYGTVPVVRSTGGLKDTVRDIAADPANGTGIAFERANLEDLQEAVQRAVALYKNQNAFDKVRDRAMRYDFSWSRSVKEYIGLYERILRLTGRTSSLKIRAPSP